MKKFAFLPIAALVFAAACDSPNKLSPMEAEEVSIPASLSASASVSSIEGPSTLCVAYGTRLDEIKAQLAATPDDEDLKMGAASFQSFIDAECK